MTKSTIIALNIATGSIAGFVTSKEAVKGENLIAVSAATDLEHLDLNTLTMIYNAVTGETKSKFKISKIQAAAKVFAAIEQQDLAKLIQLDATEKAKVAKRVKAEKVAKRATMEVVVEGTVRKVRDSKLQRMAAAFRETDENGEHKVWTIKELMEKCGKAGQPLTEKIANQYVSILRAQNDRFVMNIVKNKETGTLQFQPKAA